MVGNTSSDNAAAAAGVFGGLTICCLVCLFLFGIPMGIAGIVIIIYLSWVPSMTIVGICLLVAAGLMVVAGVLTLVLTIVCATKSAVTPAQTGVVIMPPPQQQQQDHHQQQQQQQQQQHQQQQIIYSSHTNQEMVPPPYAPQTPGYGYNVWQQPGTAVQYGAPPPPYQAPMGKADKPPPHQPQSIPTVTS